MESSNRVTRGKPSTKARKKGYSHLRMLFNLLDVLINVHPWRSEDEQGNDIDVDYKGWKEWVNKHTPAEKRGGPACPPKRKRRRKRKERIG